MTCYLKKNNASKSKASGLFIVIVMTLVISCYITQVKYTSWQQVKLNTIEQKRLDERSLIHCAIGQIKHLFSTYKVLSDIPRDSSFKVSCGNISYELRNSYSLEISASDNQLVNLYKINIYLNKHNQKNSGFDIADSQKYYKKLRLYIIAFDNYTKLINGDRSSVVKILPVTNMLES